MSWDDVSLPDMGEHVGLAVGRIAFRQAGERVGPTESIAALHIRRLEEQVEKQRKDLEKAVAREAASREAYETLSAAHCDALAERDRAKARTAELEALIVKLCPPQDTRRRRTAAQIRDDVARIMALEPTQPARIEARSGGSDAASPAKVAAPSYGPPFPDGSPPPGFIFSQNFSLASLLAEDAE